MSETGRIVPRRTEEERRWWRRLMREGLDGS